MLIFEYCGGRTGIDLVGRVSDDMPWMMVGHVNHSHQKSNANAIDEESLLAEAAAIMSNPDAVLANAELALA
jgi:hypothetical protein